MKSAAMNLSDQDMYKNIWSVGPVGTNVLLWFVACDAWHLVSMDYGLREGLTHRSRFFYVSS